MSDNSRKCRDCEKLLPLDAFPRNASRSDGFGLYCKACYSVRYRRYRENKAKKSGREMRARRATPSDQKYCPQCQQVLARTAFGRNRANGDGLTAYCKPCHNRVGRETKERLYGSTREYHLRRRYGIGQAEVDVMLAEQGGLCAACRTDEAVHVDHDHKSGQVRGMLCFLCNQALGNVRDEIARLTGLIDYLHRATIAAAITEYDDHTCCVIELNSRRLHAA